MKKMLAVVGFECCMFCGHGGRETVILDFINTDPSGPECRDDGYNPKPVQ
jgi:hypothetical protein